MGLGRGGSGSSICGGRCEVNETYITPRHDHPREGAERQGVERGRDELHAGCCGNAGGGNSHQRYDAQQGTARQADDRRGPGGRPDVFGASGWSATRSSFQRRHSANTASSSRSVSLRGSRDGCGSATRRGLQLAERRRLRRGQRWVGHYPRRNGAATTLPDASGSQRGGVWPSVA